MISEVKLAVLLPFLFAFVICAALGPIMIPWMHKLNFGQYIREEGPKAHQKKSGTPTMGGVMILAAIAVTSLLYIRDYPQILPVLLTTVAFGLIGFLDDYIKVVKKRNLGLTAAQKMGAQVFITALFAVYLIGFSDVGTQMLIPFTGGYTDGIYLDLPLILFVPTLFIIMLGTVNGTNLTDGLDGLVSGVTVPVAVFFMIVSAAADCGLHPVAAAVAGALLGFLLYNGYPAKIFMGDTGSLALGGFVASCAFMMKLPIFVAIIGFIYLLEILSDIIQVTYFKITHGKRIFRMAPFHHHLELGGWPETRVVAVFSIAAAVLCVIGLLAL